MLRSVFFLIFVLNLTASVWCVQNKNNNNNNNNNNKNYAKKEQNNQESGTFEQDLTDTFKIEGTDQGIQRVNLKCGSNSMNVVLETEKPFTGVMYTRGSFYKQQAPCFMKPNVRNSHVLEMNFQLDECQTQKDGELFSNIVVIQNDPELITPGDSAFSLECDFRQARNIDVGANFQARDRIASGSRITLSSPDPGTNIKSTDSDRISVFNATDTVVYTPKRLTLNSLHKTGDIIDEEAQDVHYGTVEEVKPYLDKDEL